VPTQPVIYMETDFQEKSDLILSRARRASSLSWRSPYVREAWSRLTELVQVSLEEHTPVALEDQWHHTRGTLKASTDTVVEMTGSGETAQFVISATQDAKNPYGTEYAPFVILGHRTRDALYQNKPVTPERRMHNIAWVTENPYPSAAMESIEPEVFEVLDLVARQVAEATVRYLTEGEGL
jgi:hypothetical protein